MFFSFKSYDETRSKHHRPQPCLTLSLFFDEHYFPHVKVAKKESKHDWSTFNTHLRASLGHYKLDELTNPVLDVWVREQVVAGYQRSTINKHIFLMNRLLNLARHWGHIQHNANQVNLRRLPLGDYKQRFLSPEEIERLLIHAHRSSHPHLYNFIRLLLLTGARKGEARTMRWLDINRDKKIWTVPVSKNGRSRRVVLSGAALEVLDDCRATVERLGLSIEAKAYVFTNPRTLQPYDSFYAAWYLVRSAAGLDDVRIHDLRHTYASLLVNKGVSIYEVQTLLGHSSVQMTQRYAHLAPDRLHSRAELVGKIVCSSGG